MYYNNQESLRKMQKFYGLTFEIEKKMYLIMHTVRPIKNIN